MFPWIVAIIMLPFMVISPQTVTYEGEISSNTDVVWPLDLYPGDVYEALDIEFVITYMYSLCSQCKENSNSCCPRILIVTWEIMAKKEFEALSCEEKLINSTGRSDFNNWNILLSPLVDGCRLVKKDGNEQVICERVGEKKLSFSQAVYKRFAFTFGSCDSLAGIHLNYSVKFTNVSIQECEDMRIPACKPFYDKVLMPGPLGYPSQEAAAAAATSVLKSFVSRFVSCYQYPVEFSCYNSFPKCKNNRRYFTCRKMCEDLKKGCKTLLEEENIRFTCDNFIDSLDAEVCYYKPVKCGIDQKISHGLVLENGTSLDDKITFICNYGYQLEGNNVLSCLPNGKWNSSFPYCKAMLIERPKSLKTILVGVFVSLLIIIIIILSTVYLIVYKRQKHKDKHMKTSSYKMFSGLKYDIFVSYSSRDCKFAEEELLEALEEGPEVPFKLCLHGRDFMVGNYIHDNIMSSIENSAICLVILSRNYINSSWCMHEFQLAYGRMIEERLPSCSLIMVMMESIPKNELPESIKSYIFTCTYIERNQPDFWKNLVNSLTVSRDTLTGSLPMDI